MLAFLSLLAAGNECDAESNHRSVIVSICRPFNSQKQTATQKQGEERLFFSIKKRKERKKGKTKRFVVVDDDRAERILYTHKLMKRSERREAHHTRRVEESGEVFIIENGHVEKERKRGTLLIRTAIRPLSPIIVMMGFSFNAQRCEQGDQKAIYVNERVFTVFIDVQYTRNV